MRFLTEIEAQDWNTIANHCDEFDGLTVEEKVRVKRAFSFLKNEFGDDFLRTIDSAHPFNFHIHNYAPPSRLWFAYLAAMIESVKYFPNYISLLKRLKVPNKFHEAYTVLETSFNFKSVGFDIEFDPGITINGRNKVPDLKLINTETKESFYCEVSVSYTSVKQNEAMKTEIEIFNAVISATGLEFAGRVTKTLPDIEKTEIKDKIINLAKTVSEELGFGVLIIEDVLILGYATQDNVEKLEDWAKNNGCSLRSFEGPYFDVNEMRRIENKINEKKNNYPMKVQI
ncbi:MAG: hypothetical protein ACYDEE_05570 [Ignavibacteriaceae bacterium]